MFFRSGWISNICYFEKMIGSEVEVDQLQLFWHKSSHEQQKMKAKEKLERSLKQKHKQRLKYTDRFLEIGHDLLSNNQLNMP